MLSNRYIKHLDTLVFALAGYLIVLFFSRYSGIGVSPDSVMYASTAESIARHGNLITFNGKPLMFFPVFYPAFLSICYFFGTNAFLAGTVINGLLFAVVIMVCGWMLSRQAAVPLVYKWFVLTAIVLSPALLEIYTYLWSETLFILLTILFTAAMRQYLIRQTPAKLCVAAIIVAFACITRYAGVALAGAGCLLIILQLDKSLSARIKHAALFLFISISLLIANLIVNYFATGYSTGTREASVTGFSENLYYFGTVLCDWMALSPKAYPAGPYIAIIFILGLLVQLVVAVYRRRTNTYNTVFIALAFSYATFILLIATFSRFERLNSRLLSPLYIPLLIACTHWVVDVFQHLHLKKQLVAYALPIVIAGGFLYHLVLKDWQRYYDEDGYGVPGYTDDDWNKSPFIQYLKSHRSIYKPGVPVYSNADDAVYFFTGMHSVFLPHRSAEKDVRQLFATGHYYVIWFDAFDQDILIGLDELKSQGHLKQLHSFEGGTVYEYSE